MDSVKILEDTGHIKFKDVSDVYEYGIEISDGRYIFNEGDGLYVAVIFEKGTMAAEEFHTKEEAMLWLLAEISYPSSLRVVIAFQMAVLLTPSSPAMASPERCLSLFCSRNSSNLSLSSMFFSRKMCVDPLSDGSLVILRTSGFISDFTIAV